MNHQDLWRKERDISNAGYLDIQKRIDLIQFKCFNNEKDMKQILQRDADVHNNTRNDGQLESLKFMNQNEISSLKQALQN